MSFHLPYGLVWRKFYPQSTTPQLSCIFMSAIPDTVTSSCTSYSFEFFQIIQHSCAPHVGWWGCLNSLLPADSIPSTLYHLLWNRDLDSIECLDTYSHQWQVLFPSIVLGIHQCSLIDGLSQVLDLNTSIHTYLIPLCTLIPVIIISGISQICNDTHQWPVIR